MPWVATMPVRKATPRFVDTPARDADWRATHAVADSAYPKVRTLYLTAFDAAQAALTLEVLRQAIATGNEAQVTALLAQAWVNIGQAQLEAQLPDLIAQTVAAGATASVPHAEALLSEVTAPGVQIVFNQANPRTLEYIDRYTGTEIRQISEETVQAVRATVRRGFEAGHGTARMARELRQSIGLTERQTAMVARYRQGLLDAGTAAQRTGELVERKMQQLIRRRVQVIARSESITASAAGQHQLWLGLRDEGILDPERYRRFWVRTPGDRTCPACNAVPGLNPEGVSLTQPFQTPVGPVLHPALHPACRCAVRLHTRESA